jgi:hypothetical protein
VILLAGTIFDMGGTLGIKYAAFGIAFMAMLTTLRAVELSSLEICSGAVLFLIWPLWALFSGAARGSDLPIAVSEITPFAFGVLIALLSPALRGGSCLRWFYACMFAMAIVIILSFGLLLFYPNASVTASVYDFLTRVHEQEGYFGMRTLGDAEIPSIYFRSTLFLVPAFVYFFFTNRLIRAGVVLMGLALSISKAGLAIVLAFGLGYVMFAATRQGNATFRADSWRGNRGFTKRFLPIVVLLAGLAGVVFALPGLSTEIQDAFTGNSATAEIREGHITSLMRLFSENPQFLIIGQGVGVPFYTSGESAFVQNVEVDHLNAVRKFGLPWFLLYTGATVFSAWRLIATRESEMRAFGFALISIYIAAGTNPVLISPPFIILLVASYFVQKGSSFATSSVRARFLRSNTARAI